MNLTSDVHVIYITRIIKEQELLEEELAQKQQVLSQRRVDRINLLEAQTVITDLFIDCSQEAKEVIELISNLALKTVFGNKYSFTLDYEIKRNQVEASPTLLKYGKPRQIKDECGEGVVDILSFGFRMSIWAISSAEDKSYFFSLDEPFKSVSEENERAAAQMLRETFSSLGIQCLLTTHSQNFIDYFDKAYAVREISRKEGSEVKLLKK